MEPPTQLTADALWDEVSSRLKEALNEQTYSTWFGEASGVALTSDAFVMHVPNDFTREWIEGHFLELIRAVVRDATGRPRRIQLSVEHHADSATALAEPPVRRGGGLNPKYNFDLFVIGSSNRFAHAAALAVAESPAQAYKPLFI